MKVQYIDAELISIKFSSLVINASSLINQTNINEFVKKYNLDCKTNGKLIVMSEMNTNHPALTNLVTTHLAPNGLQLHKDFVFVAEQLTIGVEGRDQSSFLDSELEETLDLPWLSSIRSKKGCFVYKSSNTSFPNSDLLGKSQEELLELWNREVKNNGWTGSRGVFLTDLRHALKTKGIDTTGLGFKEYRRIEHDKLVVCNDPRQTLKILFPSGGYEVLPNTHRIGINHLNLQTINTVKHIEYISAKAHLFQMNDCDKCIEILAIKERKVISTTILIGHKDKDFGQFIFGREFLIIPRPARSNRIPEQSILEVFNQSCQEHKCCI